jgi:hypothetical protein
MTRKISATDVLCGTDISPAIKGADHGCGGLALPRAVSSHRRSSRPLGGGGRRSLRQSRAASPQLSPKPRRRSCFLTSPPATALELSIAGAARALTCRNGRMDENRTGAAPPAPSAAGPKLLPPLYSPSPTLQVVRRGLEQETDARTWPEPRCSNQSGCTATSPDPIGARHVTRRDPYGSRTASTSSPSLGALGSRRLKAEGEGPQHSTERVY